MRRFAIYYAPAEVEPVARAAACWLGRDAFTAARLPAPERNGLSPTEWEAITNDPRVYGFHATLKPPFRLAHGTSLEELRRRLRSFAASQRPFEVSLELGSIARFLALVLANASPDFAGLAADCVRDFDDFRAAPPADELARRRQARLTETQLQYLDRWGYPYVLDEWRFHMTLTASLGPETFEAVQRHLARMFEPHCGKPLRVESICLFEQAEQGAPFAVRERFFFS